MERMLIVVAARALLAQARDQLVGRQQRAPRGSQLQLQPSSRDLDARARPPSAPGCPRCRIGFVLLMWM
jgi:hypothetical protein